MNIQELRDFFVNSDYSEETKTILGEVLNDKEEVTPGLIYQVKDILQKELDADFEDLGVNIDDNEEAKQALKEYNETLDTIKNNLEEDTTFVEKELNELEEVRKTVSKISDEMEIAKIKQSI
jgi:DNA-binding transcriptional MerR regulator